MNEVGKALSEEGIRLLYHNHNCELQKVTSEKTAYDVIIEENENKHYRCLLVNATTEMGPWDQEVLKKAEEAFIQVEKLIDIRQY